MGRGFFVWFKLLRRGLKPWLGFADIAGNMKPLQGFDFSGHRRGLKPWQGFDFSKAERVFL